jgi:hypothetical protein
MLTYSELKKRYLKMRKQSTQWHKDNPSYLKKYWKLHREELTTKHRVYVKKNWKKVQAQQKKWHEMHPNYSKNYYESHKGGK